MLEEKRTGGNRNNGEIVSLDELVPKFHLPRKIDRAIDWRKIYPIVEDKYSKIGREVGIHNRSGKRLVS